MWDRIFGTKIYQRLQNVEDGPQNDRDGSVRSDSSSSNVSDDIELSELKGAHTKRFKFKESLLYDRLEDPSWFGRCKLNIILSVVLIFVLSLVLLEIRYVESRKNAGPAPLLPFLSLQDFNVIHSPLPSWKLDTEKAYKLDPKFSSNEKLHLTRHYKFEISQIEALPDGVWKNLTVVNGQFPGPMIECQSGDLLEIEVENNGVEPTTIHFHGIYQNGTNFYDGSSKINQCDIPVGGKMTYKIRIDESQWGTYWYHSHFSTQYADGLFGPLVIHSLEEDRLMAKKGQTYDEDRVVLFNDWYHHVASEYLPDYLAPDNENTEPTPDNGLIQGSGVFDCSKTELKCDPELSGRHVFQFQQDKRIRMRLINAGFFLEVDFSVDKHSLKVVEVEGTNVEDLELDVLRIAVLQRYSVILKTNQVSDSNLFHLRATLNSFCFAEPNPNLDLDLRLVVSVNGPPQDQYQFPISSKLNPTTPKYGHPNVRCRELNETLLVPLVNEHIPEMDKYFQIDSSFQIKRHLISLGYLNDVHYEPLELNSNSLWEQVQMMKAEEYQEPEWNISLVSDFGPQSNQLALITNHEINTVDILINNYDDGSHPFHLHGYKFWILKFGQGYFKPHRDYGSVNTKNPIKRDTVNISGFGYALIRVVLDNPGVWPLHCHLGWHMELGLLMQVNVLPQVYSQWEYPDDWKALCSI